MKARHTNRRRHPIVRLMDAVETAIDAMRQVRIARDELNRMASEGKCASGRKRQGTRQANSRQAGVSP